MQLFPYTFFYYCLCIFVYYKYCEIFLFISGTNFSDEERRRANLDETPDKRYIILSDDITELKQLNQHITDIRPIPAENPYINDSVVTALSFIKNNTVFPLCENNGFITVMISKNKK